jgi:murein DD-endopeptidase
MRNKRLLFSLAWVLSAYAALSGCSSVSSERRQDGEAVVTAQPGESAQTASRRVLEIARSMVGAPYRYGGAGPRGFDCSGLVYYAYSKAGMEVPRTTGEQYRRSRRIPLSQLRPGDLLFFTISRKKPSHVGIYAGKGSFIHAPSRGKSVGYASLGDDYWHARLIGTGRL